MSSCYEKMHRFKFWLGRTWEPIQFKGSQHRRIPRGCDKLGPSAGAFQGLVTQVCPVSEISSSCSLTPCALFCMCKLLRGTVFSPGIGMCRAAGNTECAYMFHSHASPLFPPQRMPPTHPGISPLSGWAQWDVAEAFPVAGKALSMARVSLPTHSPLAHSQPAQ